ncbi:MAG: exodeoxyribonuclease III [Wenzhouxiangellaceae bacterium]
MTAAPLAVILPAMRIITLNANGIRAAERKGFFPWLEQQQADVVCIQETKAQPEQLTAEAFYPAGYHCHYYSAEKKGYSGVALYSRVRPDNLQQGLGWEPMDNEGRWLQADYGNLSVISLYLPSGSSGDERQTVKFEVMDRLMAHLQALRADGREYIITGDWNIAHKEIDLKNWRGNRKNSGFLPEERDWLTQLFDEVGWVDGFRQVDERDEQYTWWSNRGQAWAKNVGWRIDYQIITPGLSDKIKSAQIYKDERFSDHAPLIMDYDYSLTGAE